ncbi:diguanylate cyclase (GGDEF) domain-containing protein [Franzmannia pantelleriensis]|uniref:cyclic-guanylate-specific phosphodiesterase n=1 Tax=Franzmannia pantelleriensis TaxID=48727 RepID=A0A1G9V7F6_9GAMM|nr:EAL domain-containing protein [Halomonas pantelleriensis]SDM68152.1 diguanylate cyclase (GGDEF) domain-containing protein [Halomonas pantelleriensis]
MSANATDREVTRRGNIIQAMHFATDRLLHAGNGSDALNAVLARLGDAMGVSRVYVFDLERDAQLGWLASQRLEWVSDGVALEIDNATLPYRSLEALGDGRWTRHFEQGQAIAGRVRDMPASEQALLSPQGILSLAVMPIHVDDTLWGFIALDDTQTEREWSDIELDALQMVGDVLGAGMATRHVRQRLNELAYYDSLTGLPNRTLFLERASHAQHRAKRFGRNLAVLLLDLDRFKVINETLGHRHGDDLLRQVSQRLLKGLRASDTVARLGGDEFAILLEDLVIPQDAMIIAGKLLSHFKRPFALGDQTPFVTTSLGISVYPSDAHDIGELLEYAEAAMYRAKARGRNCFDFYTTELTAAAQAQLMLETELRYALERNEFVVHYQPIVATTSGGIVGAEALVRWQHPVRGLIAPGLFLDAAENSGLIGEISQWVLEHACAQLVAWQSQGLHLERLAVNLAGAQIDSGRLVTSVNHVLNCSGLSPQRLELEVTETFIMQHAKRAIDALGQLKKQGISLSIDDFGTGYSSLSYLKRLPIHKLKIDRSFVHDIPGDANDAAIASAIIALAHSMGLTVTAEGVETPEQLGFLRVEGCDEIQGYLISHPLPAEDFARLLTGPAPLAPAPPPAV